MDGGAVSDDAEARAVLQTLHDARSSGAAAPTPAVSAAPRVPLRIGGLTLEESGAATRPPSGAVVHLHDTLAVRPPPCTFIHAPRLTP